MADAKILAEIRKRGARRVFLQVPEGLKMKAPDIARELEKRGLEVFIVCDPCFGACDIRDREAKLLGCDLILHMGHSDLGLKTEIPVLYDEYRMDTNPVPLLRKHLNVLRPSKRIGLVTTLQYLSGLEKAKGFLESNGKKVFIGIPSRAKHPGQVLGCDFSAAVPLESQVDCFLFIGSGLFHPLGLSQKVSKPVLFLNMETGELVSMHREREMLERVMAAQVEKAKGCQRFGIFVSTKQGQASPGTARKLKEKLEARGKSAWILVMDEITPEKLLGLKLDCLVNTACPRLSEDFRQFRVPILNPEDVEKLS